MNSFEVMELELLAILAALLLYERKRKFNIYTGNLGYAKYGINYLIWKIYVGLFGISLKIIIWKCRLLK